MLESEDSEEIIAALQFAQPPLPHPTELTMLLCSVLPFVLDRDLAELRQRGHLQAADCRFSDELISCYSALLNSDEGRLPPGRTNRSQSELPYSEFGLG